MPRAVTIASPLIARSPQRERHSLQGLALEALAKMLRPGDRKAHVGWKERRNRNAAIGKEADPPAVRAELRPARPAERQDCRRSAAAARRSGPGLSNTSRPSPSKPIKRCRRAKRTPRPSKPRQPGAQERRCLHRHREDPSARPDECRLSESLAPNPEVLGQQGVEIRPEACGRSAVTAREFVRRVRCA